MGWHEKAWLGVNYLKYCEVAAASGDRQAEQLGQGLREVLRGSRDRLTLECVSPSGKNPRWFSVEISAFQIEASRRGAVMSCTEITERKRAEASLHDQVEFEKMVSEISSFFVKLSPGQVDRGIEYALQLIGKHFKLDRGYVYQFTGEGYRAKVTHQWSREGVESQKDRLQEVDLKGYPWYLERLYRQGVLYVSEVAKLPPEAAAEKEELQTQGVCSLLDIPLKKSGRIFGFMGFDTVRKKEAWDEKQIILLKVVVELIASALSRNQAEEKIRQLSFYDSLTGLYNRHFLEEEAYRMDTERQFPLSVIMADLNGLKLVNDTYGHSVGDEMLEHVAEKLKQSCREEDVIARWGGDEFVILLPQTGEREAYAVCSRINSNCSRLFVREVPVSLVMGVATKTSGDKDLEQLLGEAERKMYQHKLEESRSEKSAVLKALLKALEQKSYETKEHTRRMQEIAEKIGSRLQLPKSEQKRLSLLITLHDIGKINLPEELLTKEAPLTAEEWKKVREHPEAGYRIARATEEFAHVAEEILSHHERWDGKGYPRGLQGEEIPLLARITAIADAYEVMTRHRPYQEALSWEEVAREFEKGAGNQFDPELIEIFLQILEEERVYHSP